MTWINDVFHKEKVIIGLCHLKALPGDPLFDEKSGMEGVYKAALEDVNALQEGGIDGIQFTNEFSMPYEMNKPADASIIAAMAVIIGRLKDHIKVPFGVNCIGDEKATIALCVATGAKWTRGSYHGTWSTNDGIMYGKASEIYRLRHNLHYDDLKLVHYVLPENSKDVADRNLIQSLKSHYFLNKPDALGLAGLVAGQKVDVNLLKEFKQSFPECVLFAVTGVNVENVSEIMKIADAAFVGTSLKKDRIFENSIDINNVKELMEAMKNI